MDYPQDFDEKQVAKFCSHYASAKRIRLPRANEELLELAKLGRRSKAGFKPNLACCLLLARVPRTIIPGSYIRIIKYLGDSEQTGSQHNSVFSEIVEGPIAEMIDTAKEKIQSQINYFQRLTENGRLERRPEYPEPAWLEAVVNAVAHRSYNLKTQPIFVRLFSDRIVVESPGSFVPPVTAETIYDAHVPRNPNLMEAMWYLDLTFMNREGTNRMRTEMRNAGLPEPRFSQGEPSSYKVRVVLENDVGTRQNIADEFAGLSQAVYLSLSREERLIVNYLASVPSLTVNETASLIERTAPTATKYLNTLVRKSIVNPFVEGKPLHARPKNYSLKKPN